MAKQNNKGRSKSGPPFIMLRYDIVDSSAWLNLTPAERSVLIQIARRYNGSNNGFLGASVRELALECKIAKGTVTSAVNKLTEIGFIDIVVKGAFSWKIGKASEYRLTWLKCDRTGHLPTNDFKKYTPIQLERKVA